MSSVDVREIFRLCDTDGSGYLEKSELHSVLPHIDNNELDELLSELDTDGDGKISLSELEKGLHKLNIVSNDTEDQPETDNNNRRPVVKKTLARRLVYTVYREASYTVEAVRVEVVYASLDSRKKWKHHPPYQSITSVV